MRLMSQSGEASTAPVGSIDRSTDPPGVTTRPGTKTVRPKVGHFPCFDGLRAIAALSVLVTHVSFVSGANTRLSAGPYLARMDAGVDIFFVISGFLLYRPFVLSHFRDEARPATIPYFWRRALRIYPAYWLAFLVIVYGFHAAAAPHGHEFFLFLGLLQIYSIKTLFGPLPQTWSLATEVSFYVFLPLWAALIRAWGGDSTARLRRELIGLAVLCAASFAFKWSVLSSHTSDGKKGQALTWLPARVDLFALGMLLAIVSAWTATQGLRVNDIRWLRFLPAASWVLAGLSFWAVSTRLGLPTSFVKYTYGQWLGEHYLYGAFAFFLVLPGVFGPQERGVIRGFLMSRVMVFLGLVSYGIYLWQDQWIHQFLVWTGRDHGLRAFTTPFLPMLAFVAATTITSAVLSYFFFERPILRLKDLRARHRGSTTAPASAR
jgi:peptidoglycan/LPS O-acetylase OafA/YrhL